MPEHDTEDLLRLRALFAQHTVPWNPRGPWPSTKRQALHHVSVDLVATFINFVPGGGEWQPTLQTLVAAYLAWPDLQQRALHLLRARFNGGAQDEDTEALAAFLAPLGQPWAHRQRPIHTRALLHGISESLTRALKHSCEPYFPQALKDLYVTLVALYCLDGALRDRVNAALQARMDS